MKIISYNGWQTVFFVTDTVEEKCKDIDNLIYTFWNFSSRNRLTFDYQGQKIVGRTHGIRTYAVSFELPSGEDNTELVEIYTSETGIRYYVSQGILNELTKHRMGEINNIDLINSYWSACGVIEIYYNDEPYYILMMGENDNGSAEYYIFDLKEYDLICKGKKKK